MVVSDTISNEVLVLVILRNFPRSNSPLQLCLRRTLFGLVVFLWGVITLGSFLSALACLQNSLGLLILCKVVTRVGLTLKMGGCMCMGVRAWKYRFGSLLSSLNDTSDCRSLIQVMQPSI